MPPPCRPRDEPVGLRRPSEHAADRNLRVHFLYAPGRSIDGLGVKRGGRSKTRESQVAKPETDSARAYPRECRSSKVGSVKLCFCSRQGLPRWAHRQHCSRVSSPPSRTETRPPAGYAIDSCKSLPPTLRLETQPFPPRCRRRAVEHRGACRSKRSRNAITRLGSL